MPTSERPSSILPFSGQVGDLKYRPARVVSRDCTVADASRYFAASDVEYLVIHENRIPLGVLHKFDLVRHNMTREVPSDSPVESLMTRQVISVQRDQPVLDSLIFMIKHSVRFLLVLDQKEVMGVISQQDWLALQASYPTELLHKIAATESIDELAKLREEANETIRRNFESEGEAVSLTSMVTVINDAMTRKVIRLSLVEMSDEGRGDPPVPFAWIGMGSEGREAQTITTDQDNGLIFQNVPPEQEEETGAWFELLATKVVGGLERCGFALCNGNVMATNPDLRGSADHWAKLFDRIITTSDDEDLFEASIYFDFRCLFGKERLVADLKDFLIETIEKHPYFLRHLVETTVQGSGPPINTLRWKLYIATGFAPPPFDIKKNALVPLDAAVRVIALLDGVKATRTLERLQLCLEKGRMSKRLADDVHKAFDFLLRLRFKLEFSTQGDHKDHDHLVDVRQLPPAQARYLTDALATVKRLQEFVYEQVTGRKVHWSVR